jgi:hypothetical protein
MTKSGRNVTEIYGLGTPMIPWREFRTVLTQDADTVVDLTTNHNHEFSALTSSQFVDLYDIFGSSFNRLVLGFYSVDLDIVGGNDVAENDTFGFDLLGYRSEGGEPIMLAGTTSTACIIGQMEVAAKIDGTILTASSAFWCDTIVLNFSNSISKPVVYDSGTDRMALLHLDPFGCRYLYPRICGLAASGEAPTITVVGTVY